MVKRVKKLLKKSPDPYLALMAYRATPMPWCRVSPSQMLMGRQIRTTLPQTVTQLVPKWPYLPEVRQKEQSFKEKQKEFYDRHHRVRDLPALPNETGVWVTSGTPPVEGRILGHAESPRSYLVETPSGIVCLNCLHLDVVPRQPSPPSNSDQPPAQKNHDMLTDWNCNQPAMSVSRLT